MHHQISVGADALAAKHIDHAVHDVASQRLLLVNLVFLGSPLTSLIDEWNVPVYVHPREQPYLIGSASYPPPDPTVGGMMAALSPLFPRAPIDITPRLVTLSADGVIPELAE